MKDIVRIFEEYATAKSYEYHYGDKAVLNIIDTNINYTGLIDGIIYFLHEYRKGSINKGQSVISQSMDYTGKFFLVKKSNLNQIHDEKYVQNIEPLIQAFAQMENYFGCTNIDIQELNFIDVTDVLDENMDGILVEYKVNVPNYVV